MHRNKSVDVHRFSMVPSAHVPRSRFRVEKGYKTTFDAGYLVPVYLDEVLPGDTFNVQMTAFARLATPLFPFMDNLHLDSFFFFVPNRLIWDNWQKFMGEQKNPGDSIDYLIPQCQSPAGGYAIGSLQDYMGLPTVGQVNPAAVISHSALWTRAYNLIWNEWFRDENLQDAVQVDTGDGPDVYSNYTLLKRGKRHDYFTSALPWPQKGESIPLPLGSYAPIRGIGKGNQTYTDTDRTAYEFDGQVTYAKASLVGESTDNYKFFIQEDPNNPGFPGIYADLTEATSSTINQLRQSFQVQKLLERDARGGTRYTEIVRSHFGVVSPDARLQRPEYLGGGSTPVAINPVAQTSGTGAYTGTPQGNLSAIGTALASGHGFTQSFTEHGVIVGMVMVRADLSYQQGLRKMWSRRTRYDFYFPAFANLGEQAVLQQEIYCTGDPVSDQKVFGYQERWAEYRHNPSEITGQFRSTYTEPLDGWHLAQHFTAAPTLNSQFITEDPPVERVVAIGAAAGGQQFLLDCFFRNVMARPLPMYSVPGLIDHF